MGAAVAIAHAEGERIGAVVVRRGRVSEAAVGVHHGRAVRGLACEQVGDGIAIHIADRRQGAGRLGVLLSRESGVAAHG